MIFEKGMSEKLLLDFLHFNIFDYFDNTGGKLIDYSSQNLWDKLLSKYGILKKEIEIIVKIDGKIQPDCWEDKQEVMK